MKKPQPEFPTREELQIKVNNLTELYANQQTEIIRLQGVVAEKNQDVGMFGERVRGLNQELNNSKHTVSELEGQATHNRRKFHAMTMDLMRTLGWANHVLGHHPLHRTDDEINASMHVGQSL